MEITRGCLWTVKFFKASPEEKPYHRIKTSCQMFCSGKMHDNTSEIALMRHQLYWLEQHAAWKMAINRKKRQTKGFGKKMNGNSRAKIIKDLSTAPWK